MSIVTRAEILAFLGKSDNATDNEDGVINAVRARVERSVKKYVGYEIEQASYIHFLPETNRATRNDGVAVYRDVIGTKVVAATIGGTKEGLSLHLPELPLRSVSEVREDPGAYGGQGSSDFPDSTILVAGEDYYIDLGVSGLSKSGVLRRIGPSWSTKARTIKVSYTAGYTATELQSGIAADIGYAALLAIQAAFSKRGDTQGTIESEKLGDYAVKYAIDKPGRIPRASRSLLQPYVRYARFI